jgi:hypothetical protein
MPLWKGAYKLTANKKFNEELLEILKKGHSEQVN